MLLPLLLLSPAHAKVVGCEGRSVTGASPGPMAADVPVDVVPQLAFEDDGCGFDETWTLRLYEAQDPEDLLIAEETVSLQGQPTEAWARFTELPELTPSAAHVLSLGGEDGGFLLLEAGFTTGEGYVQPPEDGADIDAHVMELSAGRTSDSQRRAGLPRYQLFGRFEVETVEDPDGLGMLLLVDADDPELPIAAAALDGEATQVLTVQQFFDELDRSQRCFIVKQTDGRADVNFESLPVCASPGRGGCQTAPGGAWGAALLAAAALGRRRT